LFQRVAGKFRFAVRQSIGENAMRYLAELATIAARQSDCRSRLLIGLTALASWGAYPSYSSSAQPPNSNSHQVRAEQEGPDQRAGNPVLEGWYADPAADIFKGEYWIVPTYSDDYGDSVVEVDDTKLSAQQRQSINPQYHKHLFFDAFSSPDLCHWRKHPRVLSTKEITWAKYALWAPSILAANDKYYIFFAANDIQNNDQHGGIGVAVAPHPAGPYVDAIGKPLIDKFHHGAQPIDPYVFRDQDGQHYLYYGGWRHCNVSKLGADLVSLVPLPSGELYQEITPEHYVEGPYMLKRNGKYYLMWSEGSWQGPDYSVAYAVSPSPLGPFERAGKILQQDPKVATGAGHHSILQSPTSSKWYIVYHRRPLGDNDGNHREVCIDELHFQPDGTILPVVLTDSGVAADHASPKVE
jgi:hypothetical protein